MIRTYRGTSTRRRLRRATAVAAVLGALAPLVPPALAADGTDRLLRAYPLEQRPAQRAPAPAEPRGAVPSGASRPASAAGPPWPAILLGCGAAALLALVAARRFAPAAARRRGGHAVAAVGPAPAPAGALPAQAAPPTAAAPVPAPAPAVHAGEARPAPAAREADPQDVCQVRWHRDADGSWFEAVVVGGRDRRTVASSPAFDWRGRVPPDRSPGAQAALRALVDGLGETGWEPLRGRGREAGAPRWYARRFCRPVGTDARATAQDDTQPRRRTGVR